MIPICVFCVLCCCLSSFMLCLALFSSTENMLLHERDHVLYKSSVYYYYLLRNKSNKYNVNKTKVECTFFQYKMFPQILVSTLLPWNYTDTFTL